MRKRLIAILMAVSLLSMSLAGCGSEDNSSADAQSTEQQTEQQEQTQDEQTQQEQTEESSKSGDVFEVMSMSDLDGNEVDSSIFADYDLTMINIWATFCNPCLSEMPELAELSHEYAAGDNKVQIIGICTDITDGKGQPVQEGIDYAKQIVESTGADYLHLVPDEDFMEFLMQEVQAVPTTYFVDSQGKVVGDVAVGARDKASWQKEIDARLAELGA